MIRAVLRLAGRLSVAALAIAVLTLVGIQAGRVVSRNVVMSRALAAVQAQNAALQAKRRKELRDIRRLSDPRGTIPEIHDRLRMVGPHEELIYVKGLATPPPDWQTSP